MTHLEQHPADMTVGEVRGLLAALRERDAALVAAVSGLGHAEYRAECAERGLRLAADIAAGRADGQVWDASVAPGGYVCGWPVAAGGEGVLWDDGHGGAWICGYPVESGPCPDHGREDER